MLPDLTARPVDTLLGLLARGRLALGTTSPRWSPISSSEFPSTLLELVRFAVDDIAAVDLPSFYARATSPHGEFSMAWLFFIDESGHDHKTMPYEVRGGVAVHVSQLWAFVREMQQLELACFGCRLHDYGKEIKGSTLVDRKRFRFAGQGEALSDSDRCVYCRSFLAKNRRGGTPTRAEFTAYGQACLRMARETVGLLKRFEAVLLASAIPRGVVKPPDYRFDDYLRKDVVFLLERFFYFLEAKQEHGVLVMDETEKHEDRRFVARVEEYFTKTATGRQRTAWIVPTPFFVSSDMAYAVQAADLCI